MSISISMSECVYIHIYIERERERELDISVYSCIYPEAPCRSGGGPAPRRTRHQHWASAMEVATRAPVWGFRVLWQSSGKFRV